MATDSNILDWKIPWTEHLVGYSPWGHKELDTTEATEHRGKEGPWNSQDLNWVPD